MNFRPNNTLNEIMKVLARCGVMELKSAIKNLNVQEVEIDKYCKKGIIAKEFLEKYPKVTTYYRMTDVGRDYVKQHLPEIRELYQGFVLEHDIKLSEFYLDLSPSERNTWITRDDMSKKYKLRGTLDGAFKNKENLFTGIEIMSKTARASSVEATESFVKAIGIEKMNYILY